MPGASSSKPNRPLESAARKQTPPESGVEGRRQPPNREGLRFVLGVDGGQSSTTAIIMDELGRLRGIGRGGPANHIHEPGGVERVRQSLRQAIAEACIRAGSRRLNIASAYLGMTGGTPEMEQVCRPAVPGQQMTLGHDSLIALYSVTLGGPGVVVIGGTGSIGYGRTATGQTATAGGWGYIMGDEGSGYWVALRALQECTKADDGRRSGTGLTGILLDHVKATDLWQLHRRIYSGELSRPDIAGLAEAVGRAAGKGERTAKAILREAGQELGLLASTVIRKLKVGAAPLQVGYVGGVFRCGPVVFEPFAEEVRRSAPAATLAAPQVPAAVAAGMLALEEIGLKVTDGVRKNIRDSLPSLGEIKS